MNPSDDITPIKREHLIKHEPESEPHPLPLTSSLHSPTSGHKRPRTFGTDPFSETEARSIRQKLDVGLSRADTMQRPGPGGSRLTYIEGWRVIHDANQIFGFNGWSSTILTLDLRFVDSQNGKHSACVGATVRVSLRDGTSREDRGGGIADNMRSKGEAIVKAEKEAVTDATKRALKNFGLRLGLSLYDRQHLRDMNRPQPPHQLQNSLSVEHPARPFSSNPVHNNNHSHNSHHLYRHHQPQRQQVPAAQPVPSRRPSPPVPSPPANPTGGATSGPIGAAAAVGCSVPIQHHHRPQNAPIRQGPFSNPNARGSPAVPSSVSSTVPSSVRTDLIVSHALASRPVVARGTVQRDNPNTFDTVVHPNSRVREDAAAALSRQQEIDELSAIALTEI